MGRMEAHSLERIESRQGTYRNPISDLARNGVISPTRFYDAPYTSISSTGPQGLFSSAQIEELDEILENVKKNAAVA